LTWVERNKDHIEKIRTYVLGFQNERPAVLQWFHGGREPLFPYAPESDRGAAILLYFCALYQGLSEEKLIRLLAHLHEAYGNDFFRLGKLPFDELQARLQARKELARWDILPKVPGVLRSVSDFFSRHGRLLPWLESLGDGEACVDALCEEIFLMGKTSAFKSKPRYFLWLMTQLPGADASRFWTPSTLLPITPGHLRFLREFGPLKGRKRSPWVTPEEKLAYCNRFFRMLFPESPWQVYAALDAYLKPSADATTATVAVTDAAEKKWQCRDILGGCLQCVLAPQCPGREEV
jgi:hypothetical protein